MSRMQINEIFWSIQGEGYWTGLPATFLRLQGCNLTCPWCDTKRTWGPIGVREYTIGDLVDKIKTSVVVVTGGEPLLQATALYRLMEVVEERGMLVKWHLETNGTLPVEPDKFDWVTVSPKPPLYEIQASTFTAADELKFVVFERSVLDVAAEIAGSKDTWQKTICLQPVDNDPEMVQSCIEYLLSFPDPLRRWRLSIQTHRIINIQ